MSERITLAQLAAISMLTERTLRSYLKRGLLAGEKTDLHGSVGLPGYGVNIYKMGG